ncbi:MAG TPA: tetratricopeptide repeat protein [Kofleriaceae bacterium]|nr:tetratricopeptide repeat protein [Kofleriaceae bacterium]
MAETVRTTARLTLIVALAAAALVAIPPYGAPGADPARPEPGGARAQAASHFKQGQVYFQTQDYERAIAEYQIAFDLSAEPSLIFNIALCYDRTDRPELALQAFQRYLELAPTGGVADEARNDVARLAPIVARLAADRAAQEARQRDEAAQRRRAAEEAASRQARLAEHRARVARYVMVAGAAVAAIGATAHVLAWRTHDGLEHPSDYDTYLADRDRFERERAFAIGGYAVGAAALATGLVLSLTAHRGEGPAIAAALTPGGATMTAMMTIEWSR